MSESSITYSFGVSAQVIVVSSSIPNIIITFLRIVNLNIGFHSFIFVGFKSIIMLTDKYKDVIYTKQINLKIYSQ
jgi:hypothetical protein